jgi:hemoglobin
MIQNRCKFVKKNMLTDITDRNDIEHLINSFYVKIGENELMGPIFNEIANVDWGHHLPKMYDFWDMALFDTPGYASHPLKPHIALNAMHKLKPIHFDTWVKLFCNNVDELFAGEKAEEIKIRAKSIGETWMYKFEYLNNLEKK